MEHRNDDEFRPVLCQCQRTVIFRWQKKRLNNGMERKELIDELLKVEYPTIDDFKKSMAAKRTASYLNRVEYRTLNEILKALKPRCVMEWEYDWPEVRVYTNGLKEDEFFKKLALYCIDRNDYEWRINHGQVVSFDEEYEIERQVDDMMSRLHERNITVIDDGNWFDEIMNFGIGTEDNVDESTRIYSLVSLA